ncbi:MAG: hypothetical protein O3C60_13300 [Planctomycetota bacterium]|nr:hypothetical protein [Planctomycetota bacterium]
MSAIATATYTVLIIIVAANFLLSVRVIIGGWSDLRSLFRDLTENPEDVTDDGRVDDR